jgi:hypothetical protein
MASIDAAMLIRSYGEARSYPAACIKLIASRSNTTSRHPTAPYSKHLPGLGDTSCATHGGDTNHLAMAHTTPTSSTRTANSSSGSGWRGFRMVNQPAICANVVPSGATKRPTARLATANAPPMPSSAAAALTSRFTGFLPNDRRVVCPGPANTSGFSPQSPIVREICSRMHVPRMSDLPIFQNR